ncbi:MAG: EamA family transporter [Actinobacteria bacterium]|nr:EamA family transporter [Actinomycetota bacterium]
MLATAAVWGGSFVLMKDAIAQQDVYSFLSTRFSLAALLMIAYRPSVFRGLSFKFIRQGVFAGVLLAGGFIFQTFGLANTTVSNTGFITGMYLVFTPLISLIILKRKVLIVQWFAVAIAMIGLILISYNGISIGTGEILVLISAFIYGAHFVALGEWSDGKNTYALTLIQILTIAVVSTIFAFINGFQLPPTASVWQAIILTAVFATFLAFLVQTKAQSVMSATAASVLLAMETPFALLFGLFFNNDPLTLRIIVGGSLVMFAMGVVIWSDREKKSTS